MSDSGRNSPDVADPFETGKSRKVGLKPQKGWAKRNYQYLSSSLFPSMIRKREPSHFEPSDVLRPLEHDEMEIIWIGHASFFVRTPHHNILIDPVWAKWVGPLKRSREPGIPIDHLPPIDLILISHAHFDHLCLRSLRKICTGQETIIVPEKVSSVVKSIPCAEIREMSDWDVATFDSLEVTFTPCFHWGARYIHDTHRGFGGYLLKTPGHHLYHSGDSAYFDGFAEIGERHHIDTALLPIGAYNCPSGREVHMNPEEALVAFNDLGAGKMIPMHFGTFPISIEHPNEPLDRLHAAVNGVHHLKDRVVTPRVGERVFVKTGKK